MKTALIVGASGLTGKHCLYRLLESETYTRVIALVRKPLAIKHHQLEQLVVDFGQLGSYLKELHADDVYCCLGTTIKVAKSKEEFKKVDHFYPLQVAKSALEQGAGQFLLISAMGANAASSIFYNKVKGETESAIAALGYPAFKVFRPSLILGDRKEFRAGEMAAKILMRGLRFLFIGPLAKYKPVEAAAIAKAMVLIGAQNIPGFRVIENDEIIRIAAAR